MKRSTVLTAIALLFSYHTFAQQKLVSPQEFLGYELGERFTRHYQAVGYYKYVADLMPNVVLRQYGETNEYRPLVYAIVTAPENFKDIETIRTDNLKRAGVLDGTPAGEKKAIVWLSYNVHGNEASGMEASLLTLFELADPQNAKTQAWLKNTIVIIDPCINPDGRDRYANFNGQYSNSPYNMNEDAMEHHEPWPGGRSNHYMFDLNRDWAWAKQKETQHRLKIYNEWLPHVHVDFHEQGYNRPYYFAPAAEPFHEVISPWQRKFQTLIGKNHAKYFDEQGWLYFTKEVFDLYYPSYGDTYPTYSGAIGMTYEQGGGGYAGLGIRTPEDDPLTLKDRLLHHHVTGLSTIEITAQNATQVVEEFEKYFRDNNSNPSGLYKTYVIKGDNNSDKVARITSWMDMHGIRYGSAASGRTLSGFDFQTQKSGSVTLSTEDIVVSTAQPKSRFISAIFEPKSKLSDSLTYDITAWNLFYAYDLNGFALTEKIQVAKKFEPKSLAPSTRAKPYAYLFRYKTLDDASFAASLMKAGIKVRVAQRAFTANGLSFDPGTLVVTRRNNEGVNEFDERVTSMAKLMGRQVFSTSTGFVEKGKDLGSADVSYLKAPKVALLFGEQTSSLSAGEVWHFFERELMYPITPIGTTYFKRSNWKDYNVLIIPDGRYRLFDDALLEEVSNWVSQGGKLIVVGDALSTFADKKTFGLKQFASKEEEDRADEIEKKKVEKEQLTRYEDFERKELSGYIFGAIYKIDIDNSHPLAFGLRNTYFSLKTTERRFAFLDHGWNVGVIRTKPTPIQGYAGYAANKKLENSLVFGVEEKGSGKVIYMIDNPLFRDFWENGKLIFANAVFMN
ncbi:zinc carboxypeptidase [Pseudochryseolinea flava]|uniref:Zinc carboxypeptidase n=2 Tax=Pseudochryseolinea flava TaxID=2059302 RepID=A0A364Y8Y9_9BACT|nr:zinc carboxypeptidase [Pseudochryseolinea flava]